MANKAKASQERQKCVQNCLERKVYLPFRFFLFAYLNSLKGEAAYLRKKIFADQSVGSQNKHSYFCYCAVTKTHCISTSIRFSLT